MSLVIVFPVMVIESNAMICIFIAKVFSIAYKTDCENSTNVIKTR